MLDPRLIRDNPDAVRRALKLKGAQVDLDEARRDSDRKQNLADKQFIAASEADKARALVNTSLEAMKSVQAQVGVAQAQVKTAQANVAQREAALAQADAGVKPFRRQIDQLRAHGDLHLDFGIGSAEGCNQRLQQDRHHRQVNQGYDLTVGIGLGILEHQLGNQFFWIGRSLRLLTEIQLSENAPVTANATVGCVQTCDLRFPCVPPRWL